MNPKRRRAIENLAEVIRKNLNVSTPVDMEEVVRNLNGKLESERFDDSTISGKIQKHGETFKISYNEEHSDTRSKFTIAHELGHLFLHMGFLVDPEKWNKIDEYCDSPKYRQGYSEEEYEANQFAGAFLMPSEEYKEFVEKNKNKQDNTIRVDSIATHFGVSVDAALTRGKWLGIFDW